MFVVLSHSVTEAYEAATYSMARLNRTGARLMRKYGKQAIIGSCI